MTDLCYIEDETYNVIAVLFYVVAMAIVRRWFSYVTGLIRRYVAEKGKTLHLHTCTIIVFTEYGKDLYSFQFASDLQQCMM